MSGPHRPATQAPGCARRGAHALRGRLRAGLCLLCGTAIGASLAAAALLGQAQDARALAGGQAAEAQPPAEAPDGFPEVDWDYWLGVNPAVVGWVTVPGTGVDGPIVAAAGEPDGFYLAHGVDRSADPMGCAFLDPGCKDGLDAPNCVVYGHNWSAGRMFADFTRYADAAFAEEHATVLLQTPGSKRRLHVQSVEIARGDDATNVTSFDSAAELACWYERRYAASGVKLGPVPVGGDAPRRLYTFCTCADGAGDMRVLTYAKET